MRPFLVLCAILLTATAVVASTATVRCLTPNGGFLIDGQNFTVLTQGQTAQIEVLPDGSLVTLWSCGWESPDCQWLPYTVLPGSWWEIVSAGGVRIVMSAVDSPPEVPSREIILNDPLPRVGDSDAEAQVLGLPDGRVTVLMLEDFRLRALCSANGGQTFDHEIDVYGAPPENAVLAYNALLLDNGELYVAMVVGDPAGGDRLEVIRSPDAGRTWGPAAILLSRDAPGSFANPSGYWLRIAATAEGRVAILTSLLNSSSPVAVAVSSDRGESWTSPLLLADSINTFGDVAIDRSSGTVYATTMADVDISGSSRSRPVVRKSADGGNQLGGPHLSGGHPDQRFGLDDEPNRRPGRRHRDPIGAILA